MSYKWSTSLKVHFQFVNKKPSQFLSQIRDILHIKFTTCVGPSTVLNNRLLLIHAVNKHRTLTLPVTK